LDSMAEKMFTNIQKPGKKAEFVPGDIGANGERVTGEARVPYDGPYTRGQREKLHYQLYRDISAILGNVPSNRAQGIGGAAGTMKDGTPVVWTSSLTPQQVEALLKVRVPDAAAALAADDKFFRKQERAPDGELLIKNADAFRTINDAIQKGEVITLNADVDTTKGKNAFTNRAAFVFKPFGFSQTPTGGFQAIGYNLQLLNDLINYQKDYTPFVKKALNEFGIKTLDDVIPLVNEYFRNYSDGSPKPAADAIAAFAPKVSKDSAIIMRDLLHLGGNIKPKEELGYVNKPTIPWHEMPSDIVQAVTKAGKKIETKVTRDRNVFSGIRMDAVYDASKYAPNGVPVRINVDRSKIFPPMRANFSPGKGTVSEVVGDTKIITDTDIGARIVVPKNKKAQLFMDGKLVGEYADELDAVLASNKKSAKQGAQVEPRQQGQTSKEVETMRRNLMYGDLRSGKAAEELTAVHDAIRAEIRSPDDLPAWVESKNLRESTERKTQSEMRRRRKSLQKIREQSEQFWSGDAPSVVDAAEINVVASKKKGKPEAVTPEVLEQIAMQQEGLSVTPPAGKKADALKNLPKPKKELKSLSELTPIIEAVQEVKTEPKSVADFISKKPMRRVSSEATTMYPEQELAGIPSVFENVKARPEPAPEPVKPETTAPAPEVVTPKQDARIPQGFVIRRTPRGMFMVVLIAKNASVAVEESYEKAVQKARKRQKVR